MIGDRVCDCLQVPKSQETVVAIETKDPSQIPRPHGQRWTDHLKISHSGSIGTIPRLSLVPGAHNIEVASNNSSEWTLHRRLSAVRKFGPSIGVVNIQKGTHPDAPAHLLQTASRFS